jgi:hypothetical protein
VLGYAIPGSEYPLGALCNQLAISVESSEARIRRVLYGKSTVDELRVDSPWRMGLVLGTFPTIVWRETSIGIVGSEYLMLSVEMPRT